MEFSTYQLKLKALDHERGWDRVLPAHTYLHMGEELGEIGRVLQYLDGYRATDRGREDLSADLAGELADLTVFIFKLASQHGIDMDAALQGHLEKFLARNPDVETGRDEMRRYVSYQERSLEWVKGKGQPSR